MGASPSRRRPSEGDSRVNATYGKINLTNVLSTGLTRKTRPVWGRDNRRSSMFTQIVIEIIGNSKVYFLAFVAARRIRPRAQFVLVPLSLPSRAGVDALICPRTHVRIRAPAPPRGLRAIMTSICDSCRVHSASLLLRGCSNITFYLSSATAT
jgi:hypothetical protein